MLSRAAVVLLFVAYAAGAWVRFANWAPALYVGASIDGIGYFSNVGYQQATAYQPGFDSNSLHLLVYAGPNDPVLVTQTISIDKKANYTLFFTGSPLQQSQFPYTVIAQKDHDAISADGVTVRVVNLALASSKIDVYVDGVKAASNLASMGSGGTVTVPVSCPSLPTSCFAAVGAFAAGSKTPIAPAVAVTVNPQSSITIVIGGFIWNDLSVYSASIYALVNAVSPSSYPMTRVRVANFYNDTTTADFYLNDEKIFSSIPFGSVTTFLAFPYTFASQPFAFVTSGSNSTLGSGYLYSYYVNSTIALFYSASNFYNTFSLSTTTTNSQTAPLITFALLTSGITSFDLYLNGSLAVPGLSSSFSVPIAISAGSTDFAFNQAGTKTMLYSVTYSLEEQLPYMFFLYGGSGTPSTGTSSPSFTSSPSTYTTSATSGSSGSAFAALQVEALAQPYGSTLSVSLA